MTKYEVGDLIGHRTMGGLYLYEITSIEGDEDDMQIHAKKLRNPDLSKPISNTIKCLLLPQQYYEILSFEEYVECMQNDINKRQGILNKIKEANVQIN